MHFRHALATIFALAALVAAAIPTHAAVSDARVQEIAAMLPAQPTGLGKPIADRAAWTEIAKLDAFQYAVTKAEELAKTPIPDQPDELFLDFSKTGNRNRWQAVANRRRGRIATFCVAECIENKGRFVKPLEDAIRAICAEKTWVMPAHDGRLNNFNQKSINIDLGSSMFAWNLATTCYLMGDKLSPEVRELARERTTHFIIEPFIAMATDKRKGDWWMRTTNNWNAVCLAGVTGTALAWLDSPKERAFFIAAAESYSKNFLRGFTPDGYCTEGLGYWNYGFGYYVRLGETVWQATSGKLDLLARPSVQAPARFGANIEIINRTYPAFADCSVNAKPSGRLMHYLSLRFGLGLREWEKVSMPTAGGFMYDVCIYSFPNSATAKKPVATASAGPGLRSYFNDAGILICRPASTDAYPFGVGLKGGHNAEHHNHNDVGSYVAVNEKYPLAVDPGGETYTARTFSAQRYVSGVLNSFGHPVPLVAGKLQSKGRQAAAKVLDTGFTDAKDTMVLDISAAYDVPELTKLERTFVYDRAGKGSLTIEDRVEFLSPEDFGTALITLNNWHQASDDTIYLYNSSACLEAKVVAEGGAVAFKAETIEDGKRPTRIGINYTKPVAKGLIRVVLKPIDLPKGLPGVYAEAFGKGNPAPSLANAIVIQAEDFSAQQGGDVSVDIKPGAEGKAFKYWDPRGHTLEWKFTVPKAGAYTIQLRQCHAASSSAKRQVFVDGSLVGNAKDKGEFLIPGTGGWSSNEDNWENTWLAQEGNAVRLKLTKGEHTLKMVNTDGLGVNLDLIRIVPLD